MKILVNKINTSLSVMERLFKLNCTESEREAAFKIFQSSPLHSYEYAICLLHGIGCKVDKRKAVCVLRQSWEQSSNPNSLFEFAYCTMRGIGCEKNEKEAFNLFKLNWEKYKHFKSFLEYSHCLQEGIGCEQNRELANVLRAGITNFAEPYDCKVQ